jgi:oxygen-dependent protoporphyrinogen oxidase
VAGLAAAYRLVRQGHDVMVYEASSRAGGSVHTERRDGFLAEHGPNSMQTPSGTVAQLLRDLGLDDRRVVASRAARKRYVVRNGRPQALPLSPPALLTSSFFSAKAKLTLLTEPLASAAPAGDESIAAFVRRRFGHEVLDYAAAPFVSGIYAGDPEALSIRHALPRLHAMEREYGSVMKGAVKAVVRAAAKGGGAPPLMSFREGMGELTDRLAASLGARIRLGAGIQRLRRSEPGWDVEAPGGTLVHQGVILAAPAYALATIQLGAEHGDRLADLAGIPYPPVAVLVLGFHRGQVEHRLDGFGMLVPAVERRRILGVVFSSTLFPDRAPPDHVTLSVFAGGACQPEVAALEPGVLEELVLRELGDLLGVRGAPVFRAHTRWTRAIPQYVLGYERFTAVLDAIEAANPHLRFAGSYRQGVALGDALRSGLDAADRLHDRLAS